ncbi:MAG: class B sortase [Ruminococcus sp.]|jgi:sortase B|nr:class B sortase [Ruminococcus sp.]
MNSKPKKSFKESFIPSKSDDTGTLISKIIVLASVAALLVCLYLVGLHFYRIWETEKNSAELGGIYGGGANAHVIERVTTAVTELAVTDASGVTIKPKEPWVEPPRLPAVAEMLALNEDYQAYISIPGVFSEVVVKNEDNEFYLTHNFYGQKRSAGTVFADYRNVINGEEPSDNIVLYGHNNRDGTMFGNMDFYKYNAKYWLKNPFVYFDNFYSQDVYVILCSFITNTEPEHDNGNVFDYHNYLNFDDGQFTFESFKDNINRRTQFFAGLEWDETDKYITLSTCSYEWEPSRHVMICRKLRPGETVDNIDTTRFELNPNPEWPAIYRKYMG